MAIANRRSSFQGMSQSISEGGIVPVELPTVQILLPNLILAAEQLIWEVYFVWEENITDFALTDIMTSAAINISNLQEINGSLYSADLLLPANTVATGTITVLAASVRAENGLAPAQNVEVMFDYDTTPITDAPTLLCERTQTYSGNTDLDQVLLPGEETGGSYTGIMELVKNGDYIYFVVQVQKYVDILHGPDLLAVGATFFIRSPQAGAVLFRLDTTTCAFDIVKAYPSITLAARSLVAHNNRLYYIEGSHYAYLNEGLISVDNNTTQYVPRRLQGVPDDWKGQIGHVYSLVNPTMTTPNPDPVDLGLNYASALPSESPEGNDRYYGIHGGTASPIRVVNNQLTMVTGYGVLDRIDDNDDDVAKYANWQVVKHGVSLEFRLPDLQTNDRTGFDIIKELAVATNSIVGFDNNEFVFRPRIPFRGTYSAFMDPQITVVDLNRATGAYPAEGLVSITNTATGISELIEYENFTPLLVDTAMIEATERGAYGTTQFQFSVDDPVYWVDHFLGLNQTTLDQPINTIVVSEDTNNIYNRIVVNYEGTDPYVVEDADSIEMYGVREFSVSVPLGISNSVWAGWIAESILNRFKTPNSIVNLQLQPSWHLKVGEIVFLQVKDRLDLEVPTQVVTVDHDIRVDDRSSQVTTNVRLLTL